jgi:hypothetical protein
VARIEHLSVDVTSMDTSRQLRDDNLLLRKDLQAYQVPISHDRCIYSNSAGVLLG